MAKPIPRPRAPSTIPPPSAALLSFLGPLLAVSSRAAASPAPPPPPPPFLCPSIYSSPTPSPTIHPRSAPIRPPSLHRRFPVSGGSRALPLHFEPGDDGVWRRVQTYTLYGSTICSQPCHTPSNTLDSNQVSDLDASNLTESIKLHDTLPAGWFPSSDPNENRTALIFALSLVLAILISLFIVGCLFWRKSRRRRRKRKDLEMRTHRKSRSELTSQPRTDARKEAKERQKIWARATARWRQNALYAARKRRGRRPTSPRSHLRTSSTLLHIPPSPESPAADHPSSPLSPRTPSDSPSVSRRSSIESHATISSSISPLQETTDTPHNPLLPISVDSSTSSPPAYRQRTFVGSSTRQSDAHLLANEHSSPDPLIPPSPHPSHVSPDASPSGVKSPVSAHGSQTPRIPIQAAHVATDDKTLLARLAELAERPPGEITRASRSSHQVFVPVWEDEEFEDFTQFSEAADTGAPDSTSQLPYPPPPSKGKMAESSFYAYRGSFEEFSDSIDPETGPSAPPFEVLGRPAHGDTVILPSAPPLVEDDFPLEASEGDVSSDAPQTAGRSVERIAIAVSRPLSDGNLPGYQP